ncbi:hypothetical protein OUZ56_032521 [Daphnia magna]|uniref:Ferritin-like domain-containing protein n=1 Tax=Daphnia magna TaxID=35525 RepID=A0ABR0B962_9CRUS|nr:hypothetical protein OUZ56_032521 [Daphnia magna]
MPISPVSRRQSCWRRSASAARVSRRFQTMRGLTAVMFTVRVGRRSCAARPTNCSPMASRRASTASSSSSRGVQANTQGCGAGRRPISPRAAPTMTMSPARPSPQDTLAFSWRRRRGRRCSGIDLRRSAGTNDADHDRAYGRLGAPPRPLHGPIRPIASPSCVTRSASRPTARSPSSGRRSRPTTRAPSASGAASRNSSPASPPRRQPRRISGKTRLPGGGKRPCIRAPGSRARPPRGAGTPAQTRAPGPSRRSAPRGDDDQARRPSRRSRAPVEMPVRPVPALEEIARENRVEGCLRETYGAAVGAFQAARAEDRAIAAAMVAIARDEAAHAELSWAIDAWATGLLDGTALARLDAAYNVALAELRREIAVEPGKTVATRAGIPTAAQASALLEGVLTVLATAA